MKFFSIIFVTNDKNYTERLCDFTYLSGNVKVTINNDTVWENLELLRRNYWTKVTITLVHQRDPFRVSK